MKKFKFIHMVSLIIICFFVISVDVSAEDIIKPGDTIRVPLQITTNPGICTARIKIEYDKETFSILSQENGDVFPLSSFVAGNTESDNYYAVWIGLSDINKVGTLLFIDLKVNETAKDGEYTITASYDNNDVFNLNETNVDIEIENPTVVIGNSNTPSNGTSYSHAPSSNKTNGSNSQIVINEDAKSGSLNNFKKSREYDDKFEDVTTTKWYYDYIKSGYEYMLINGKSDTEFDPKGNITVAEAITLATNIRTIYYNEKMIENSNDDVWYKNFIDSAIHNNIITENFFDSYDRPILRKEMAYIFSNILPGKCYENINILQEIPDMQIEDYYYNYVIKLYGAGILTGDDDIGTFGGDRPISRCETAAIANRLAIPALRIER